MKSRPNKPEKLILNLLNKLFPSEWKYVGDRKLWIHGRNPDFINKPKTKLIEHFGTYYHGKEITGMDNGIHEKERINHFYKYGGFDTLIIWENELINVEKIIEKLADFNSRNLIQISGNTCNKNRIHQNNKEQLKKEE